MRVVHVIGQLTPGGSEKVTVQVAAGLRARGQDHRILALGEVDGAWVESISATPVPVRSLGGARSAAEQARLLGRLMRAAHAEGGDVFQGHALRSSLAVAGIGTALRRPAVATLHRVYYPRVERVLDRAAQAGWSRVIVDSTPVRDQLVGAVGIDPRRIAVIPNFVDERWFSLAPPPPAAGAVRILMAAHFTPVKGHERLLRALGELGGQAGQFVVDFLGDGPLRSSMEALSRELGLEQQVRFHGVRADLERFMAEADIVALPSAWEGFGMILAEGMAASRPVVAVGLGGATEVVADGETGFLVPLDDHAALAGVLLRLAEDPALRARLGAAGRERAARLFGREPVLDAYARLYDAIARVR